MARARSPYGEAIPILLRFRPHDPRYQIIEQAIRLRPAGLSLNRYLLDLIVAGIEAGQAVSSSTGASGETSEGESGRGASADAYPALVTSGKEETDAGSGLSQGAVNLFNEFL